MLSSAYREQSVATPTSESESVADLESVDGYAHSATSTSPETPRMAQTTSAMMSLAFGRLPPSLPPRFVGEAQKRLAELQALATEHPQLQVSPECLVAALTYAVSVPTATRDNFDLSLQQHSVEGSPPKRPRSAGAIDVDALANMAQMQPLELKQLASVILRALNSGRL